jgi:GNAT superfamily N-acetyltransferase
MSQNENVSVVRTIAQDAGDALALVEEYYEAANVVARDSRAALIKILCDPNCAVWVAYLNSQPVGCILYKPLPQRPSSGEMKRLYVRPEHRGHGVAAALLETVEKFSLNRGDHWLYLDTKDDLTAAQRFYKRHGYQTCERYNDNPQATMFMRKALSP